MKKIFAVLAVGALVAAPQVQAQSEPEMKDIVAYGALMATLGATSPVASPVVLGQEQAEIGYTLRYGRLDAGNDQVQNAVSVGASRGSFGLHAGYASQSDGTQSEGHFMAGASFSRSLFNLPVAGHALNIGADVGAGFARPDGATILSGAASLPIAFVARAGNWTVAPFVQPGYGYGRVSEKDEASGVTVSIDGNRPMIGAGLGLVDASRGLGFHLGMQQVRIEGGDTQYGIGMTWNPSR